MWPVLVVLSFVEILAGRMFGSDISVAGAAAAFAGSLLMMARHSLRRIPL
jgi:hypothetical protein